jgi:secreted trypsin-like serine protease
MKKQTMKQAATVFALTASALFTSCAPQSQSATSSYLESAEVENSNIVGGQVADANYQKSHGIVQLRVKKVVKFLGKTITVSESICTGSLITRDVVLTAAHCVASKTSSDKVDVLFGLTNVKGTVAIAAKDWIINPAYVQNPKEDDKSVQNDIAIVKLSAVAPADFKLAVLPTAKTIEQLLVGSKLTFAGFGITNAIVRDFKKDQNGKPVLDKNGQPLVVEFSSEGSGTLRKVSDLVVTQITSDLKEISLDQRNLKGACHGDSGGPALLKLQDGTDIQVGVTSRGTNELGNCNEGVIYTGVLGHQDFINKAVAQVNKK